MEERERERMEEDDLEEDDDLEQQDGRVVSNAAAQGLISGQRMLCDVELWPYEHFDTNQMLAHFKSESDRIAFVGANDEHDSYLANISEAYYQHIAEIETKLSQGLT